MFSSTQLRYGPPRNPVALGFCKYLTSELLAYWKATFALLIAYEETGEILLLDAEGLPAAGFTGNANNGVGRILAATNGRDHGLLNNLADLPDLVIAELLSKNSKALAWARRETQAGPLIILIGFQDNLSVDSIEQLRQLLVVIRSSMPIFSMQFKPRVGFTQDRLTNRQRQIMSEMCEGSTYRQIAASMFLSESTVKQEVKRIFSLLGVSKRADAITVYLNQLRYSDQK